MNNLNDWWRRQSNLTVTNNDSNPQTMTSTDNHDDNRFAGRLPRDKGSPDRCYWAQSPSIEHGAETTAMNTTMTMMGHYPHAFLPKDDIHTMERSMELLAEPQGDINDVDEVFHDALPFPSSYDHEPSDIPGKKIRFAKIIATDMETTSWLLPHGHLDVPFASEPRESTNSMTSLDLHGQETTHEASDEDDQDEDASSQMSEESEDENTRIRRQLWYAVSGAGVVALLGWTAQKILQRVHRRVDEDEDDRVAGGDVWGNNPISDHLQLKEIAKGMFTNQGNKGSPSPAVSGLYAAAESGSLNPAAVQQ